jgi:hypothetical protein
VFREMTEHFLGQWRTFDVRILKRSSVDEVGDLLPQFRRPARFSNGEELGMGGPIIDDSRDLMETDTVRCDVSFWTWA